MACAIVRSANICMSPLQHVLHRFFSRVSVYIVFIRTEPDVTLAETGDEYFDLIPPIFNATESYTRLTFVTDDSPLSRNAKFPIFQTKAKVRSLFAFFFYPFRVSVPTNFFIRTKVTGETTLIFLRNVLR